MKSQAGRMILQGVILVAAVINLLALGISAWANDRIGTAIERYAAEFANDAAAMEMLMPVQQIVMPLNQVLGVVGALNLFVMAWFYLAATRKGSSAPSEVPPTNTESPHP